LSNIRYPHNQRNSHPLDYIFHPDSIAIVGISADLPKLWIKQIYLDSLLKGGYPGNIYLVNPRGGEMVGIPIYRSLLDIPDPVDYVIISVPAPYTPAILEQCCQKGVKVVHVFASGYAETGEPERIQLQKRLQEIARRGNIRIIGPNCLGIYYPKGKIGLSPDFPLEPGPIGYLSQSGGNVTYMVRHALSRGLRFSKVVSYGNACDINECDLLDYMAEDSETKVIAAYIEGASDGQRLVAALNKAASAKPVVVFKGGYTDGGLRAASSHTGALAGADATWDALLRQAGAIRVDNIEEMVDMLVALLRVSPPKGPNTCVVGNGGGASVMVTDELERVGLRLIPLPEEIRERLKQFIDLANSMLRNPIDAGPLVASDGFEFLSAMGGRTCGDLLRERASTELGGGWGQLNAALKDWPDLDLVVFQHGFDISPIPVSYLVASCVVGPMILAARACPLPKAVILHSMGNDDTWQASAELRAICVEFGLPLFLSVRGAGLALSKLMDYNRAYPDRMATLHE
jgi:succinyl-CoA synthetase alpha subunit